MSIAEEYFVDLLDNNDNLVRRLSSTTQGSISMNVNKPIRSGGKLRVLGEEGINWQNHRVQIWHRRLDEDPWSMGVYLVSAPGYTNGEGATDRTIELHDKTKILDDDKIEESLSLAAGAIVTAEIEELILSTGEAKMSITESSHMIGSTQTWKAGTTKLRIINDLLDYINYFSIWVDGDGVFRGEPYSRPSARPLVRTFQRGKDSLHMNNWTREQDVDSVPNKVVVLVESDGDEEGLRGVAENNNPESPYSFVNVGRWIVEVEDGVEAADEAAADAIAMRRLISLSSPSATISIRHAVLPMRMNDVVRVVSGSIDTTAVVERMDFKLAPGSLCKSVWREVMSL